MAAADRQYKADLERYERDLQEYENRQVKLKEEIAKLESEEIERKKAKARKEAEKAAAEATAEAEGVNNPAFNRSDSQRSGAQTGIERNLSRMSKRSGVGSDTFRKDSSNKLLTIFRFTVESV